MILERLDLNKGIINKLKQSYKTVEQIKALIENNQQLELLKIPGIGVARMNEIVSSIKKLKEETNTKPEPEETVTVDRDREKISVHNLTIKLLEYIKDLCEDPKYLKSKYDGRDPMDKYECEGFMYDNKFIYLDRNHLIPGFDEYIDNNFVFKDPYFKLKEGGHYIFIAIAILCKEGYGTIFNVKDDVILDGDTRRVIFNYCPFRKNYKKYLKVGIDDLSNYLNTKVTITDINIFYEGKKEKKKLEVPNKYMLKKDGKVSYTYPANNGKRDPEFVYDENEKIKTIDAKDLKPVKLEEFEKAVGKKEEEESKDKISVMIDMSNTHNDIVILFFDVYVYSFYNNEIDADVYTGSYQFKKQNIENGNILVDEYPLGLDNLKKEVIALYKKIIN